MSNMPKQKPGRSVQEAGTPSEFLREVEQQFGQIVFDLAANEINHVADGYYGPGGDEIDSLQQDWHKIDGLLWLNPPFGKISPWASKCGRESLDGAKIAMLVPASVGSNWFKDYVHGYAKVLFLSPRLTFVGHKDPYPKDLMLCLYGVDGRGYDCWRWDGK